VSASGRPSLRSTYREQRAQPQGLGTRIIGWLTPPLLLVVAFAFHGSAMFSIVMGAIAVIALVAVAMWTVDQRRS
jgi:hypothetical protein